MGILRKTKLGCWLDSHKIVSEIVDQTLHFLIGALITVLPLAVASVFGVTGPVFLWAGFGLSVVVLMVRELIIQWPIERWWDTVIDSFFWVAGAVIVVLLIGDMPWQ